MVDTKMYQLPYNIYRVPYLCFTFEKRLLLETK